MVRKSLLAAALGFGVLYAAPAMASKASEMVASIVEYMQPMVGPQENSDFVITSIKAENEILVLRVDGPSGWRKDQTAKSLTDRFMSGFCQEGASLFDEGMMIRVETTEAGGSNLLVGANTNTCPA